MKRKLIKILILVFRIKYYVSEYIKLEYLISTLMENKLFEINSR